MIRLQKHLILCLALLVFTAAPRLCAQGRMITSINDGWKFLPRGAAYAETVYFNDAAWENVQLPHTWNAADPFDDDLTYRRGESWYRRKLSLDNSLRNQHFFLYFEGANQDVKVYVNGSFAGDHQGGYTGFAIDITPYLDWKPGAVNQLAIQVSNAHNPFIPPLNVGYASYGGIYRDAWLITTGDVHVKDINTNSGGVYLSTPEVSTQRGRLLVNTTLVNEKETAQPVKMTTVVRDANGNEVARSQKIIQFASGAHEMAVHDNDIIITNPHLWSPSDPYLYRVTTIIDANGVSDVIDNTLGFRWYSFDAANGFYLNGKKLVLHGTNRHQDLKSKGDALSAADHRRDMQLIKDMGCNFVRLAHYPQAAEVLRLADELGLLIWEETPIVNFITRDPRFTATATGMIHEMITQGYNHPSVVIWGSNNEILLHGPEGERLGHHSDTAYLSAVRQLVKQLDSTVRAEDPARYSTMAMHVSGDYAKFGLDTITQIKSYNIYSGWYSGKVEDFANDLDRRKGKNIVFISEYGAEGEVRLNSDAPVRMDYTGEYQRYYHEAYLRQINLRPWLAGTAIWNEFDFSQPNIGGPAPHMNQKGMITWDRKPKDVYYFYKANWNPEPMVYIASRNWLHRGGQIGEATGIEVYSNLGQVSLSLNGKILSTQKCNDVNKCTWQVNLQPGRNSIIATAKKGRMVYTDEVEIYFSGYAANLRDESYPFQSLSINVGSASQYQDASNNVWVADHPYQKDGFGFIGGRNRNFDRKDVILGTDDEPMFYSFADSIQSYQLDVPGGQYRVTLSFAEPDRIQKGERVFDVLVNDQPVVRSLDLTGQYGFARAAQFSSIVTASGSGITIRFNAIKGSAILNGLQIEKLK